MCAKQQVTIDLVPLNETRHCDKCGAWTWWATSRQTTKGRCLDCAARSTDAIASPEERRRAMQLLLATFPDATVSAYVRPRYPPGVYHGADAGPCTGCGKSVRRYGADAHPFCLSCQPEETS